MTWDGRTANEVWLRCYDCEPARNFLEVDYRRHVNEAHPERPEPDAMTVPEVAKALKIDRRQALRLVARGKIHSFTVGVNRRRWVRPKDLRAYVREAVAADPAKAAAWAATGAVK